MWLAITGLALAVASAFQIKAYDKKESDWMSGFAFCVGIGLIIYGIIEWNACIS